MTLSRHLLYVSIFSLFLALLCVQTSLGAEEQQRFSQKPEILKTQLRATSGTEKGPAASRDVFKDGPTPQWIWGADDNRRYVLQKKFKGGAKAGRLIATCDDKMTLFLNGQQIARSDAWLSPVEVDVEKNLQPGENILTAEVQNFGGVAGFVMKLALTLPDGKTQYIITDTTWRAAEKKDEKEPPAARKVGKLGDAP